MPSQALVQFAPVWMAPAVVLATAASRRRAPAAASASRAPRPVRIYWAEDAESDQFLIRQSIKRTPGTPVVTFFANGEELLAAVAQGAPDLVVLDLNMPVMDGLEALRRLRRTVAKDVPVAIFSTARTEAEEAECLVLGAIAFLQKPTTFGDFAVTVDHILALARRSRSGKPSSGR